MRISREQMLMEWAHTAAKRGTCGRLAVGAIIALDGRPISAGYVGAPEGEPHCWDIKCDLSKPCTRTIHAEENAIRFAYKKNISVFGSDMYCTDSPCPMCAQAITDSGIRRYYFGRAYRVPTGIEHMLRHDIQVYQVLENGMIRRHA